MSLKVGFESLKTIILSSSICLMLTVHDVSCQVPLSATRLTACCHFSPACQILVPMEQ